MCRFTNQADVEGLVQLGLVIFTPSHPISRPSMFHNMILSINSRDEEAWSMRSGLRQLISSHKMIVSLTYRVHQGWDQITQNLYSIQIFLDILHNKNKNLNLNPKISHIGYKCVEFVMDSRIRDIRTYP